ncbi:NAD(P)-binding domain-containing protein [Niveispirillum sp.]|uniref:NAD(P)-binding domain-containing protein n=1 Tax=Niveispirillum sp. TaxID=1917217 RepID=UPI0025D44761|nr:NAD(P)-binding domain-containing protein [Niveispirillum sp.]
MRYAGQHVLVIGAGHSAANALLDLAHLAEQAPGTRISWAVRSTDLRRTFGGGDADALAARGALGSALRRLTDSGRMELYTGFKTASFQQAAGSLAITARDGRMITGVDQVIVATGQRPDLTMLRELRLGLDPWLESTAALGPLIDPNLHSCGTVRPHGARELSHPEPGFFTVGIKSYGRAPTFLMATGYEQVRSVAALLAGDFAAAAEVQLQLPETGVCGVSLAGSPASTDCCGGPAPAGVDACCDQDATAKAAAAPGCGCPPAAAAKTCCAA